VRAEELLTALRERQRVLQEAVFQKPPQDFNEFTKLLGIWMGLNDALGVVEDARKRSEMTTKFLIDDAMLSENCRQALLRV